MTTTDTPRAEALAWLVGRLRFEHLLNELHERAEHTDTPLEVRAEAHTASAPRQAA